MAVVPAGGSGFFRRALRRGQVCLAALPSITFLAALAALQLIMRRSGWSERRVALNASLLPTHLPVLVSINGELRSRLMEGIHVGRRFLINARFTVCCWELIARQGVPNPAPNQPYFRPCAIQFLLKSAGRHRLVIQLTQWCTSTSVIFFHTPSILILLPTTMPRGGKRVFRCKLFAKTDTKGTAGREVLFGDFVIAGV